MYNVKQNDRSVSLTKDKQIRMLCCVCVQFTIVKIGNSYLYLYITLIWLYILYILDEMSEHKGERKSKFNWELHENSPLKFISEGMKNICLHITILPFVICLLSVRKYEK